ncbi:hypothetical protein FKM82_007136 [Ascaphus truei]
MHHVQEMCAGKAAAPDEQKFSSGTIQCRKNVPSTSHFRTIAPKIIPKVVSSCTSSCYPPSLPDIAVSGVSTKPLVMPTQNYALMKVAGHDGTFSLVALPQVNPQMGAPVIQTTNIPLQENPKLPIPRYQSTRNKKLFEKKSKVKSLNAANKMSTEKHTLQVTCESHSETIPKTDLGEVKVTNPTSENFSEDTTLGEGSAVTSATLSVSGAKIIKVNNPALPSVEKCLPKTFCASSSMKLSSDAEKTISSTENGSLVRCESTKAGDPANPLTVLSSVMFGSPVHIMPPVPQGKLPILPYSRIKNAISKCKQSVCIAKLPDQNVGSEFSQGQSFVSTSTEVPTHFPMTAAAQVSTLGNQCCSGKKPDAGNLSKPNGVLGKRRVRKRKAAGDLLSFQTKLKLVGNKLLVCKDKSKVHVLEVNDRKAESMKKYRSIMPKPVVEVQTLASLGSPTSVWQTQTMDTAIRNKFLQNRPIKWKQGDGITMKQSADCKSLSSVAKAFHKCHVCDHNFQFKHHLQDHLNTHTNRRPYHCRLCRKAYVHSGSLSTHVKLHHSESRLKKLMCCEFCAKVFGHIRVYFGHLKEVHRVILSTETSTKELEKNERTIAKVKQEVTAVERGKCTNHEEDPIHGQTDEIKLQIKCGRCHVVTPTFADMKLHLFCEHGDEFQERLKEGILESRQGAQEEVVKHATHHWKLLSEKRNIVKCSSCEEEFFGSSKLRKHICFTPPEYTDLFDNESMQSKQDTKKQDHGLPVCSTEVQFCCSKGFNCILCKQVFEVKDELIAHWQQWHNCEDPSVLWYVFCALSKQDKEAD